MPSPTSDAGGTPQGGTGGRGADAGVFCNLDGDCCPDDDTKTRPGPCGCGMPDTDGDRDGKADCIDGCPDDADKTDPGACGCGVVDADGDGDDTADCNDQCPSDPDKTTPGACDCGTPDTDGDGDQVADCDDGCPSDANKSAPGTCGCGNADDDPNGCGGLIAALVHRYTFAGSGATADDSVGSADATLFNTTLDGSSSLALGGTGQYLELPAGTISTLTNATIELWAQWSGGSAWQRLFDFGTSSGSSGTTYVFVTTSSSSGTMRAAFSTAGSASEVRINAAAAFPSSGLHHVALVIDDAGDTMALYVDGALEMSAALTASLSSITDAHDWIGRSQYSSDPYFTGSIAELRIYGSALNATQIGTSFAAGPDPAFLGP